MKKTVVVDIKKCLACKSCEVACGLAHSKSKVLVEAMSESPRPQRRVTVEIGGGCGGPQLCRHCEDAPCMSVCPKGAIYRYEDNGTVLIDIDKCVGCKLCFRACPFGVISVSCDGKAVVKCDLCIERVAEGAGPACVESCPTGALKFCELTEDIIESRRAELAEAQAGMIKESKTFTINAEKCKACGKCIKACPVDAISGAKKVAHVIDQDICVRCGLCEEVCPFDAVVAE